MVGIAPSVWVATGHAEAVLQEHGSFSEKFALKYWRCKWEMWFGLRAELVVTRMAARFPGFLGVSAT